jgi:DNA-binding Lrp family transcriptional regulator
MDTLDRNIVHALGINGRASFRLLGTVLGVSEQTVARRYARLTAARVVRVVTLPRPAADDLGQQIRLHVQPGSATRLADALAARDEVSWVRIAAAGAEVICGVRARSRMVRDQLLLEQIPQTGRVTSLIVHDLLHVFRTGGSADWDGFPDGLDDDQRAALRAPVSDRPHPMDATDHQIAAALAEDGRRSAARIAALISEPEPTVRRRLDVLLGSGAVRIDIDHDHGALGFPVAANLYLDVEPRHLHLAGATLANHDATVFVAATTGPWNVCAAVVSRDIRGLYDYIADTLAGVPGIRRVESSMTVTQVKLARVRSRPAR